MDTYAESDDYENILKTKKVCRFCLAQNGAMGNIYVRDTRLKASAPLPLQIMAIASIEVFNNDGMPSYVCDECRLHFEYCYRFKHMCKRADTLLRQYPLVGKWPDPLSRPRIPTTEARDRPKIISQDIISLPTFKTETSPSRVTKPLISKAGATATQTITTKITIPNTSSTVLSLPTNNTVNKLRQPLQQKQKLTNDQPSQPKPKLLNASPADTPEPPVPKRLKLERATDDVGKNKVTASTIFFNKVENNEELSMNDVQMLIQAVDSEEEEQKIQVIPATTSKPKILNKATKRILNKEANVVYEPRLSKPQIKRDEAGNVELVAEILDPHQHEKPETDPLKSAPPVETNVFPCPYCVRSFPLQQLLDIHMINHTRERKHQCTECEKSFFSKYDLQKHVIIHTGERPFACSVCDKSFTRAALLQRHEKTHTDIAKYICVYCEKQFICKAELDKHTERHLKVRPFECTVCKKTFAFKQGLERHETTHFTNKPLNCQYCDMSFFTAGKLARHLTAHAGKRAYPCKFCNKSYTLSHHLSRHLRSHIHKMSTFECTECTFKSNAMEDYFKHLSEHAANNGFCQLCKQPLDNKQAIDEHFKEHWMKDAFACEFCDCIFLSAEMLQAHTNKEHTLELQEYEDSSQDIKIEPKLSTSESTSKAQIEVMAEEEVNLEDMGIYLDDILVDDVLLLNDEPKRQQQQNPKQQSVTVKETIKVEPATKQEQLKFEREQQTAKQGGAEQKQKQEQQVSPELSAKSRKVLTSDNQIKKIIVVTSPNKNTTTATSPPVRRKAANSANNPQAVTVTKAKSSSSTTTTSPTFRQTKIKLEKEETEGGTQVSQVLKTLPKSVSVRRSAPNQAATTTTTTTTTKNDDDVPNESAAKDLPTPPPQRRTTRVLKKSPMVEEPVKNKPKMQQKLPFTKEKVDDQTKKRRSK